MHMDFINRSIAVIYLLKIPLNEKSTMKVHCNWYAKLCEKMGHYIRKFCFGFIISIRLEIFCFWFC
jgi:hypothetical protein